MSRKSTRWAAAAALVFGAGSVLAGVGLARSDDKKPADKPAKTEDKKADQKKAEEKKLGFDPKDVRVGPPPELAALRAAVEEAGRKGENVDEVRKKLDDLEKALAGKPWVKPKPAEEPPAAPRAGGPNPLPFPQFPQFPPFPGGIQPVPFPGRIQPFQPDLEAIRKAQDLMFKAARLRADDPAKAEELMKQARDLMTRGLRGGIRGGLMVPPVAFGGGNVRLGVRVESVPPAIAEQDKIPDGRGVRIAEVVKGSPAEKAGLKAGDIITEVAGKPADKDPSEFVRTVRGMKPGDKVDIVYYRNGKKQEAKGVTLADQAADFGPMPELLPLPQLELTPRPGRKPLPLPPGLDGAKSRSVSVKVENGKFTITAEEDGVKYRIEGTAGDGKPVPSKIEVTDGKKTAEAATVDKLPAEYRDPVQKLLDDVKVAR